MTAEHPSRAQLELIFLGSAPVSIREHVKSCSSCEQAIGSLRSGQAARSRRLSPGAFVEAVRAKHEARKRAAVVRRRWQSSMGAISCAAALALLVLGTRTTKGRLRSKENLAASHFLSHDILTAKGGQTLSVVRRRGSQQELLSGNVVVIPGDQVRVRLTVTLAGRMMAGLIADSGGWLPVFDDYFEVGTHVPEATLDIDSEPGAGLLVVGAASSVEFVRRAVQITTREKNHEVESALQEVSTLRLLWQGTPK